MYTEASDSDAVAYNEFLSLARDEGLIAVEVRVVQAPGEDNGHTAVVQAIARTRDGDFGAVGEASPASAPAAWRPFLTTLAELRAKARALREMTGLEHAVQEELDVPYRGAGEGKTGERELPSARQARLSGAANTAGASPASTTQDEPDEPVDIAAIPGLQRGMGGIKFAPRTPPAPCPSSDADENSGEETDDEEEDNATTEMPTPRGIDAGASRAAPSPAPPSPAPRQSDGASPDYDAPPDYDAVPPDMLDKLKRLAKSIAELEG
ncbi:MAG: hypothetical protein M3Y74_08890, partial [Chloroflexota bacterium]|nr:hypothetical protein [Chloroflexota bacterium]